MGGFLSTALGCQLCTVYLDPSTMHEYSAVLVELELRVW
jgi:hypothetical protein